MSGETIVRIGPIEDGQSVYLLMSAAGAIMGEKHASDEAEGLRALVAGRDAPSACEPAMREAAGVLGLSLAEPNRAQEEQRADRAIALAGAALPPVEPPVRRRSFLQGLGALIGSPSWRRLEDEQTALISVSGQFQDEPYNLGISAALAPVPGAPKLLLTITDFGPPEAGSETVPATIEATIGFDHGPAFLIEALQSAFALPFMPDLETDGRPADAAFVRRFGPALGASFFVLADLDPDEGRHGQLLEEDALPMQLRVSAGFGLADAEDIFD